MNDDIFFDDDDDDDVFIFSGDIFSIPHSV